MTSLDLNTLGVKYLWFDSLNSIFWAMYLNTHGKKIHVTWEIFTSIVEDANTFLFKIPISNHPLLTFLIVSFEFCILELRFLM